MAKEKSIRSVLTLPLLTEKYQEDILEKRFHILEHLENSLIGYELRKLKNLERTKAYKNLIQEIENTPKNKRTSLYRQKKEMLKNAGFTEYQFKDDITPMQKHFVEHIATHVAHRCASDVWRAFDKYLFGAGKKIHFKRKGTLSSAANQTAGVTMSLKDQRFIWAGGQSKNKIVLNIRLAPLTTYYEKEMMTKPMKYFRVVRKWMKTRYKYYLQITFEGAPVVKPHHTIGKGRVGIDIGTQSVAIVSQKDVKLLELADKVNTNHKTLRHIQRKMDTSRRKTNPDNYNDDGTIKRTGSKRMTWVQSNKYKKLAAKARELQRKNADIRKYQHNCLANYVLSLGNQIYVEEMNFHALQLRSKETKKNKNGEFLKKKRFGKSLANKAPAMFVMILENKAAFLKDVFLKKIDTWTYRASQYDHLSKQYNKKKLSIRNFHLQNGDFVQRDLYSAFLIMNASDSLKSVDQDLCDRSYGTFKMLQEIELTRIINENHNQYLSSFGITSA